MEGDFTTVKNRTIETDSGQYGGKQNDKWNSGVSGKQSSGSKPGSLVEKMCRIDSRRISNKCSPLSKKFVHRKNPKQNAIGRKISLFQKELGKIDPRSGNFICSKGVCDIILETSSTKDYSKTGGNVQTQELLIDQEIMEMLDKRAIKKRGTSILRSIPEQYSTGKKEA